ncbi:hypothetical protein PRIPAC_97079 [Pristionchus pacificus]|uniref:Uncharacterized protein n=1 Tax=Pristionchus pacificus TaxID=54126 RepID=A0A2A6B3H4_PRIPA|nr:hypothetical protein PRIPAC_97079 [Pristionchus pacificus]|eukprot:PDM60424.1 hypothetical protein PRIPAC_54249 [Pristionchus pacificus]
MYVFQNYSGGLYWCRKCRLDRIQKVVSAARGEDIAYLNENAVHVMDVVSEKTSSSLLPEDSIIGRIRANHHLLSVLRLTAELELHGIVLNQSDAKADNYEPIISTYQDMNDGTRVLIRGLFAFINTTFPEFQALRENSSGLELEKKKLELEWPPVDGHLRRFMS